MPVHRVLGNRINLLVLLFPALLGSGSPGAAAGDAAGPDRSAPEVSASWWTSVRESIRDSEYQFRSHADESWSAPNRSQGLRVRVDGREVALASRKREDPDRSFRLRLDRVGREGEMIAIGPAVVRVQENRLELHRDGIGLTEWYVNRREGVEQGFTLERAPAGDPTRPVILEMAFPDELEARTSVEDGAVLFVTRAGDPVLRYGDLHVQDATGRPVEARLDPCPGRLRIRIHDEGATYPLTVDPLMTTPDWTGSSNTDHALYGFSVATAGDVNADGYSDVIVGARDHTGSWLLEGASYLYLGSATGLGVTAAWTVTGGQFVASLGNSVAPAGDVNGDGYGDVLLGAPNFPIGGTRKGRAYLYLGSASGLDTSPVWSVDGDQTFGHFASSVATAGDVNGDGYDDVLVGQPNYANGELDEGRAFLYLGSASGPSPTPDWTVEGNQTDALLGTSVATVGDVNGDGYDDVALGVPGYTGGVSGAGGAFVYAGSASGLGVSPTWTLEGSAADSSFGNSVATAGDVDGDGYADVIVGAQDAVNGESQEGRAFLFPGSATGPSATPAWIVEGDQIGAKLGGSVAPAGDVDGDGYADVIVGAFHISNPEVDEGRALVYLGSSGGLSTSPVWTTEADLAGAIYGFSVAAAGDVDGDGFGDVIVGSPNHDNVGSFQGAAFLYLGSADGPSTTSAWSAQGGQSGAGLGESVAAVGDANGDGYGDIVVGAPRWDGGEVDEGIVFLYYGSTWGVSAFPAWSVEANQAGALLGSSVGGAGDVDGDGYADVIAGAPGYSNGESGEGRAFVYLGFAWPPRLPGAGPAPAWTAEANQAGASFGSSVGRAGDVNADGYGDVIVGAPGFTNGQPGEGRAFLYLGSAGGLDSAYAWTAEADVDSAAFGSSVATAGDVDADGFSDVVVGAPGLTNGQAGEGGAFLYLGSVSGTDSAATWTAEADLAGASFGGSVATAGDVNGDGFSDVIVGAPGFANGETGEGRAFVYLGSGSGLAPAASWTAEADQVGASFGSSVAMAGDVDGDGFSDVIVGAPGFTNGETGEGRASIYLGSGSGLSASAAWTAEADQVGASFGSSVATAGDVDADGFGDVIVGLPGFDGGATDDGSVLVYHGNGGGGLDRLPRQMRVADSGPIALLGRSDSGLGLRLGSLGRSAAGRSRVRLRWEVKSVGALLDGSGMGAGPPTDTGVPDSGGSAVTLNHYADGLTFDEAYHWRARVASDSPFFPWGPWLSPAGNGREETDFRAAPPTTPVILSGLSAVVIGRQVEVRWFTSLEVDNDGFRVYRSLALEGPYAQAQEEMIPGGSPGGLYRWVDGNVSGARTYFYRVGAVDFRGREELFGPVSVTTPAWGELRTGLAANRPNPFGRETAIVFTLGVPGRARLSIYDVGGRLIRSLVDAEFPAGEHVSVWDGRDARGRAVSAGVYLYRLEANGVTRSRKMIHMELD